VNGYENMHFTIEAMKLSFTDPLFSLARVKNYYSDSMKFFGVIKDIQDRLLADGIVYKEGEPGSVLYHFKL
jgi:hypothetical protein